MSERSDVFVNFGVELWVVELSKAFILVPIHVYDNRSRAFVCGLKNDIFSSDETFQSSFFRLVKLSHSLVDLALSNYSSMVWEDASNEASRPGCGVQVDLTQKGLGVPKTAHHERIIVIIMPPKSS